MKTVFGCSAIAFFLGMLFRDLTGTLWEWDHWHRVWGMSDFVFEIILFVVLILWLVAVAAEGNNLK